MRYKSLAVALTACLLSACGQSSTDTGPSQPDAGVLAATESGATLTSGGAGSAASGYAGAWRCKAQDNIPIGLLDVAASGNYTFTVVRNSLWEPKPGDPGNGAGTLAPDGDGMTPVSGPLVDEYEILAIVRVEGEWGVRIFLNNDYGTLLHCGLASAEG